MYDSMSTGTNNTLSPIEASKVVLSMAETTMDAAGAKLDSVLSDPNATQKQIDKAFTAYNTATDSYAKALINAINYSSSTTTTNNDTGGGGGGGGFAPSLVETTTPVPPTPTDPIPIIPPPPPVKVAPIDTILIKDDSMSIETMQDLIFENIGGQELINIARTDTINGQPITYQPIKNLTSIQQSYNSNNIISIQQTSDKYFAGFSIKLNDKIPEVGNGPNGSNIYIDSSTGELVIESINLNVDEQIQVQILVNGTIYEADI